MGLTSTSFIKGHHQPEAVKEKIRQSKIGAKNPNFGKKLSDETRSKMSISRTGKPHPCNPIRVVKHRESLKAFYQTDEGKALRQKLSELIGHNKIHFGYRHSFSDEVKAKMSVIRKKQWEDEEWAKKTLHASALVTSKQRPTNTEKALKAILDTMYPGHWDYVGDGKVYFGRKNPDFINVNGKKQLMEMYGDYFHRNHNPQDRIDIFAKYGYSTLIVWAHELKYPDELMLRIKEFCNQEAH